MEVCTLRARLDRRVVAVAFFTLLLTASFGSALAAAGSPPAVFPGQGSGVDRIDARCPTFIWGAVPGAESYELAVYRVDGPGDEPELLLEQSLPGSATAWTPALPSSPALVGSLALGSSPRSIFVSGSYAYVTDQGSRDLKVIDVSDPSVPSLAGSLGFGDQLSSLFVSGRYAYVADIDSGELRVVEVTGAELSSAIVHSLEAGSLQVRESAIVKGQLQVSGGATIGPGGLFSDGNVGVAGTLALTNDVVPTYSPANGVQLYAEDAGGSSELKVRDEAGNVTTLSPHNFSLVGGPSEPLAWSYYSENDGAKINVDMLRTVRLVEELSGEQLVRTQAPDGTAPDPSRDAETSLRAEVEALRRENQELRGELARIQQVLGIA